jgi:hypothetical protein
LYASTNFKSAVERACAEDDGEGRGGWGRRRRGEK